VTGVQTCALPILEEFGCERAEHLTREEIDDRYEQFKRITAIESVPAT